MPDTKFSNVLLTECKRRVIISTGGTVIKDGIGNPSVPQIAEGLHRADRYNQVINAGMVGQLRYSASRYLWFLTSADILKAQKHR